MGIPTIALDEGPDAVGGGANSQDDDYSLASYGIGYRLFNGDDLGTVMYEDGRNMHPPGTWAEREWPSFESDTSTDAFTLRQDGDLLMDLLSTQYFGYIP